MSLNDYMAGQRRIDPTPKQPDPNAKLKSLAGIIQGLSYREMKTFSDAIHSKINEGTKEIPEILLEVSDETLKG